LEIDLILQLPEYYPINVDNNIKNVQKGRDYYDFLENRSLKMQNRVADIVRHTVFDENCSRTLLLEAILHYQKKSGNIDKNSPILFLTPEERIAIFDHDKKFRRSLYKALLYLAIFEAIKSGVLNVSHSEKYRSLDDYLIPKLEWEANKDEYLQRAQLSEYSDCQATLNLIDQELDDQYKETNNHFISGENEFLRFRKDGSFHVSTPKLDETESMSLGSMFPEKKYIPLLEVLATVDHLTGFLEEFEHWQPKYKQERPKKKTFFAGIMAYGCDIGHRKLAQTSKEINENELNNTLNWYFSLANIQKVNDRVLHFMNQMDLPNIYRNNDDMLHTSSDGQKCEVTVDSLNSNHSFKYLGKDKGVSVMSFIDMRHMIWYSTVISSSEREAAYVIDGLMHNDVIKSDIHSTDTHGFSEMIFAVTYLLGFKFAPRIKGIGRQQLYAFSSRKETSQNAQGFKPDKYVNEKLIVPQWNEVLRFIATIKLKVATASQLFRRLNSYSKQHPLYKALKEFGKLPKTNFILKYSDDPDFRQSIEKQLNKVENSHKLGKAISICNDHAFLHGEKEDQDIAEGCRRLIKNILMAWNYTYLKTKIDEETEEERKQELINGVQKGSIMWWGHFNFSGEFDFSDEKMVDSIGLKLPKKIPAEGG
jgi:TnpA family transposase